MTDPHRHDHDACVARATAAAEAIALHRGVKLTDLRRQVLTMICQSHKPVGAYQLLADLSAARAENTAPPTVYRALDFLVAQGLVHRLDSLNAFVACFAPEHGDLIAFLICDECKEVTELDEPRIQETLDSAARKLGFGPTRSVVEVHGLCSGCRGS